MKSYLGTKGDSRKTVKFLGKVARLIIPKTELMENSPVIDALQILNMRILRVEVDIDVGVSRAACHFRST